MRSPVFRRAAEQGHALGQTNFGWMYEHGCGVRRTRTKPSAWHRRAVEQGHALGQYNLGVMYERGRGGRRDEEGAVRWYRAAEQGPAPGHNDLGSMYRSGDAAERRRSCPLVPTRRRTWPRLGQYKLGWMYENGRGAPGGCARHHAPGRKGSVE